MVAKRESMVTEPSPRRQRQPGLRILFDALGAARIYDVAQQAPRVRVRMLTRGALALYVVPP